MKRDIRENTLDDAIECLNNAVENSNKQIDSAASKIINSSKKLDEAIDRYIKENRKQSKLRKKFILIIFSCSLITCLTLAVALLVFVH